MYKEMVNKGLTSSVRGGLGEEIAGYIEFEVVMAGHDARSR
jgi:hypothetical protein